jgi:PTH1 family peptidyl-tRNA hydrolase
VAGLPLKLVVGLGNPGREYAATRHNAGWWYLDALARSSGVHWQQAARHQCELARARIADTELWLAKPVTFMNRSGAAVASIAGFYRIEPQEILIVHDDIDLAPGTVRLKQGGGHGGHNGLRDVIAHLGAEFWRLRIGVGHPGHRDLVLDAVLDRPTKEEQVLLDEALARALPALPVLLRAGAQQAMQALHARHGASPTTPAS